MSAPTEVFVDGTGVISSSGESSGLLLQLNPKLNRVTLGFRGTFTTAVVAVRGHIVGLSATSYYPIPGVTAGSGLPVANPLSMSLTNSTNQAFTFDYTGCDYLEVWAVSGTLTDLNVDENQTLTTADTPPLIVQAQTSSTTISANQTFTDSTELYFGTGNDIGITWDGSTLNVSQAAPNSAIYWGISGAGIDHVFYGDTATYNLTWDQSADSLIFNDNAKLAIGSSSDIVFLWDNTDLLVSQATADSIVKWGVSGAGINHVFYGDTATRDMTWDQTNNQLLFNDSAAVSIGTGAGSAGDISISWDATRLNVTQLNTNSEIRWGIDGAGIDQRWYGDTASAYMLWDQSADQCIFGGVATVSGLAVATSGATAITTTRAVAKADSGGIFTVNQGAAYTITVATPAGAGEKYTFQLVGAAANDVTLVATACSFEGTIVNDVTSVLPCTGSTLKFIASTAALGDNIEIISTSTSKFFVRAVSSTNGGITIT